MYTVIMTFVWLAILSPTMLWNQASSAASVAEVDPSLVKGADNYLATVATGDASAVAALYREDAVEMPMCQPMLRGRAAIEQYYREFFRGPARLTSFTFTHLESKIAGDTAYDVGTYQRKLSTPAGAVSDEGKFSVILKRTNGEWKIAYLIYNSDFLPKGTSSVAKR